MAVQEIDGLLIGHVETNIRTLVSERLFSRFASVLITSIDSMTELRGIGQRIAELDGDCSFVGSGVVVPGQSLVRLDKTLNLFNGFDEVWCFDRTPARIKPKGAWLVAPLNLDSEPAPPELHKWMADSNCQLGLGDGIGLNFAAFRREIADEIVRRTS
jgi:hypothetical protein